MTSKIDIKKWGTDEVIFSYECEDNTIKKTVEQAIKQAIRLDYAKLIDADLSYANLRWGSLSKAKLDGANLSYANLENAELFKTGLYNANLSNTNLKNADLRNAWMIRTNLKDADLSDTILDCANLDGADLSNAKIDYPMLIPDGEFIAWKKVNGKYIIKLKILADSKRSRGTTFKCRCDKALVLEIQNLDGSKSDLSEVVNDNYAPCTYKVGEIVEADSWDENRFNECSHGIHFFLDRELAVKHCQFTVWLNSKH